jgi:hypothetical protein
MIDSWRFEAFVPPERHLAESSSKRLRGLDVLVRRRVTEPDVKALTPAGLDYVFRHETLELNSRFPSLKSEV